MNLTEVFIKWTPTCAWKEIEEDDDDDDDERDDNDDANVADDNSEM